MSPAPESATATILLVEDDEATTETFARMLRLQGYRVQTALSAEAGLREVGSSAPDAIILDLRMPEVDGLEFLRRLRTGHARRDTPVAVVTGDYFVDETVRTQLRELNAQVRYKPLWLEDLVRLVDELLDSRR